MNSIDKQLYTIMLHDSRQNMRDVLSPLHHVLERMVKVIPFEVIAGLVFLSCLAVFLHKGMSVTVPMGNVFIILLGMGCLMCTLSLLFAHHNILQKLQAIGGIIGSLCLMLLLQLPQ